MIFQFNYQESALIKSFAVKQSNQVKLTTRFLSGKLLMFAKLSLRSFIYEMLEIFSFPDKKVQEIFQKYGIEKVHIYHVLTDTDSTCLKFLFVSDPWNDASESKYRVITASEIYNRFDSSRKYWERFNAKNEDLKKFLGYFENFVDRINSLINFDTFQKPPADFKEVSRLTVSDGEMTIKDFILLPELPPYHFAILICRNLLILK